MGGEGERVFLQDGKSRESEAKDTENESPLSVQHIIRRRDTYPSMGVSSKELLESVVTGEKNWSEAVIPAIFTEDDGVKF
jgi:hypothetical protein